MIWKKDVYDSLTSCASGYDEFATECARSEAIEGQYRRILLSLDCADICRQLAVFYVRGAENTPLLAKACMEMCEKCAKEARGSGEQVNALCQQTISSCISILNMAHRTGASNTPVTTAASLFHRYGIAVHGTLYK